MELGFDKKTCHNQVVCNESQYKCRTGECISKSLRCNGRSDCSFGDDEHYCSIICPPDKFACIDGTGCIDHIARCDGKVDCSDVSDENLCEPVRNCSTCK